MHGVKYSSTRSDRGVRKAANKVEGVRRRMSRMVAAVAGGGGDGGGGVRRARRRRPPQFALREAQEGRGASSWANFLNMSRNRAC